MVLHAVSAQVHTQRTAFPLANCPNDVIFRVSKFGDIFDSISIENLVFIGCMHTVIALIALIDKNTHFNFDFGDPAKRHLCFNQCERSYRWPKTSFLSLGRLKLVFLGSLFSSGVLSEFEVHF